MGRRFKSPPSAAGGSVIDWIEAQLDARRCGSTEFFYDRMASQSGRCLPIIYVPLDTDRREHWRDRGAAYDYLLATHGEGRRLLDFGPGDGWPSLLVAPFARQVIGVDASIRRVNECAANARRLGAANAHFVFVAPCRPLPFDDGFFDGAMAASSVEQTPDPLATLSELCRVLRPGGRLRMHYESLGAYRGGREREVELEAEGAGGCLLTLYDRDIEREVARMARLTLDLPAEQVAEQLPPGGHATWDGAIRALAGPLRSHLAEVRLCTLRHPSGRTLLGWLARAGFREAHPTRSGADAAGELYDATPPTDRPADLAGLDALVRPVAARAVATEVPVTADRGFDAMITAVK